VDTTKDTAKTWKRHGKSWFKTLAGGEELAEKAYGLGAMATLEEVLRPLIDAIAAACQPVGPQALSTPFESEALDQSEAPWPHEAIG
jgi:hypothetical protein